MPMTPLPPKRPTMIGITLLLALPLCTATFTEDLLITPLLGGRQASAHFFFATSWERSPPVAEEEGVRVAGAAYGPFPKALGHAMESSGASDMRMSFSKGRWDHRRWGNPPSAGASGGELWARVPNRHMWHRLKAALSGLMCASLELMDDKMTVEPRFSFPATHSTGQSADTSLRLFHGMLPREVACTENLTPFTKMLPCRDRAGLAAVIDAVGVFSADYHAMSTYVSTTCPRQPAGTPLDQCERPLLRLVQELVVVLDAPADDVWSVTRMFDGTRLAGGAPRDSSVQLAPLQACPVASASRVSVGLPQQHNTVSNTSKEIAEIMHLEPTPDTVSCWGADCASDLCGRADGSGCEAAGGGRAFHVATFNLPKGKRGDEDDSGRPGPLDVQFVAPPIGDTRGAGVQTLFQSNSDVAAAWHVRTHRFLTGFGQHRGGLVVELSNTHPTESVRLTYLDAIPSFLRVFSHTATVSVDGVVIASGWKHRLQMRPTDDALYKATVQRCFFVPGEDRGRPAQLEMELTVAAGSTVSVSVQIERAFLGIEEFPPDAARGLDVPPAIVSVFDKPGSERHGFLHRPEQTSTLMEWVHHEAKVVRMYTEGLLVMVPEPDFSMPYNVITLTSTLIAFFFGTMLNVIVRRPKKKVQQVRGGESLLQKLKQRCRRHAQESSE